MTVKAQLKILLSPFTFVFAFKIGFLVDRQQNLIFRITISYKLSRASAEKHNYIMSQRTMPPNTHTILLIID